MTAIHNPKEGRYINRSASVASMMTKILETIERVMPKNIIPNAIAFFFFRFIKTYTAKAIITAIEIKKRTSLNVAIGMVFKE